MPTGKRNAGRDDRHGSRPTIAGDPTINLALLKMSKILIEIAEACGEKEQAPEETTDTCKGGK